MPRESGQHPLESMRPARCMPSHATTDTSCPPAEAFVVAVSWQVQPSSRAELQHARSSSTGAVLRVIVTLLSAGHRPWARSLDGLQRITSTHPSEVGINPPTPAQPALALPAPSRAPTPWPVPARGAWRVMLPADLGRRGPSAQREPEAGLGHLQACHHPRQRRHQPSLHVRRESGWSCTACAEPSFFPLLPALARFGHHHEKICAHLEPDSLHGQTMQTLGCQELAASACGGPTVWKSFARTAIERATLRSRHFDGLHALR